MSRRYPIAPSSCAVVRNSLVQTSKSNSCLRAVYGKHNSVPRGQIPKVLAEIGDFWEGVVGKYLAFSCEVEKPVEGEIGGVYTRGFIDFYTPGIVVEAKALASSGRRLKIIRKGEIDESHLIQTVIYMILTNSLHGQVHYGYVHHVSENDATLVAPENSDKGQNRRVFNIRLNGSGILVDGILHECTVEDIYSYMLAHNKAMRDDNLPDRPAQPDPYSSPCNRCDFARACDWFDEQVLVTGDKPNKHEMLDRMAEAVPLEPFKYSLYAPKIRKKKA